MLTADGARAVDVRGGLAIVVAVVALPREPTIIPLSPTTTTRQTALRICRNLSHSFRRRVVNSDRKTRRGGGYREVILDGLEGVALERDEHVLELLGEHCMD